MNIVYIYTYYTYVALVDLQTWLVLHPLATVELGNFIETYFWCHLLRVARIWLEPGPRIAVLSCVHYLWDGDLQTELIIYSGSDAQPIK